MNGYAYIHELDTSFSVIEIGMDISPRWISADLNVREDNGKMALMKGPFVYCLEEADNGDKLSAIYVSSDVLVEQKGYEELPYGISMMIYEGKRLVEQKSAGEHLYTAASFETVPILIKAVPYCLWGNNAPGEMIVWQKTLIK